MLRSEWLKLVTVRSTFFTTLVALLLAGGISALAGAVISAQRASGGTPLEVASGTLSLVALVVGVLGVLSIGGEYSTLQIRSSAAAVPSRWPIPVAKAVVVGAWSFVLGLVVTFGGFGLMAVLLGGKGVAVTFDADVVGALVGGAFYLAIIAVFAVGLGTLVRAPAAGITVVAALLFVAPIIVRLVAGAHRGRLAVDGERLPPVVHRRRAVRSQGHGGDRALGRTHRARLLARRGLGAGARAHHATRRVTPPAVAALVSPAPS